MRNIMCLVTVLALFALPAVSSDKKDADPATEIRAAMADPENVVVVIADPMPRQYVPRPGNMAVIPVSGIANLDGSRVTVKAGTFVIADMQEVEKPKKAAEQLLAKWKSRTGDNYIVVPEGARKMMYTFFFGELKADRTFNVVNVVLAAKPK
ncbi:MAG: hypothetical protein LAN70_17995 [Acidobacteriia bacterium]|nr:hypothetical protein [Terriglobia bacterium]